MFTTARTKPALLSLAVAASIFSVSTANAVPVVLDEWFILRGQGALPADLTTFNPLLHAPNTAEIFRDSFNDGMLPPSGPDDGLTSSGNTYLIPIGPGGFVSETTGTPQQGKLTIDPKFGEMTNPTSNVLASGMRRLISSRPTSPQALVPSVDFSVHALIDLSSLPTTINEQFNMQLTDRDGTGGTDNVFIEVGDLGSGPSVFMCKVPGPCGASTQLNTLSGLEEQILLSLFHDSANAGVVRGAYSLYGNGSKIGDTIEISNVAFGGTNPFRIFTDPNRQFTRPTFVTTVPLPMPEAGTLLAFGFGLAGLGLTTQRRSAR